MYKIDLHTHSSISHDGGITEQQYQTLLEKDPTAVVAITDHNEISLAQKLSIMYSGRVIVGEEIMSESGEIIGLFLHSRIQPGLSALATCQAIKEQGGLVYVPHPFEKTRHGIPKHILEHLVSYVDIIEGYNARSKEPWLRKRAEQFAKDHGLIVVAASDAHGRNGLFSSYVAGDDVFSHSTLLDQLSSAHMVKRSASWLAFIDPVRNKINKLLAWIR